jgi:hypothetical protein
MVKNGTRASPAIARASSVLPVPGEPTSSAPLGIWPPSLEKRCGSLRNSTISSSSSRRLVDPGDVLERHPALLLGEQLGLRLAEAHRPRAAALLHLAEREEGDTEDQQERQRLHQDVQQDVRLFGAGARVAHAVLVEQRGQLGVVGHRHGGEFVPFLSLPVIRLGAIWTSSTLPSATLLRKSE